MLAYDIFATSNVLERVARNLATLREGNRNPAVALVQGALIEFGYLKASGASKIAKADGIFGHGTHLAVVAFQKDNSLKPTGVVDSKTLLALDSILQGFSSVSKPPPPVLKLPLETNEYRTGYSDPDLGSDPGAGKWNSSPTKASTFAMYVAIQQVLPGAYFAIGDDATKHLTHYLAGLGNDYIIDLEGMVVEVPSARLKYEEEAALAKDFIERLAPGEHWFSAKTPRTGYNTPAENANWYFATGGYSKWGRGQAIVKDGAGGRSYDVKFEYRFYDRYNWDKGKSVTIAGIQITDEFMGEFHRQGLAREFDCKGSFQRHLTWTKGAAIPKPQLYATGSR